MPGQMILIYPISFALLLLSYHFISHILSVGFLFLLATTAPSPSFLPSFSSSLSSRASSTVSSLALLMQLIQLTQLTQLRSSQLLTQLTQLTRTLSTQLKPPHLSKHNSRHSTHSTHSLMHAHALTHPIFPRILSAGFLFPNS